MNDASSPPILFHSIGVIKTPYEEQAGSPIQPIYAQGVEGTVLLLEQYADALVDLDGFERIWLIYYLDRSKPWTPRVVPYRDTVEHGLFATRSPARPNSIGMSAVRLLAITGRTLHVEGVDILDGTPLLDIKPYVPAFDAHPTSRAGWFDSTSSNRSVADDRFR